jgi:hypothetical protein
MEQTKQIGLDNLASMLDQIVTGFRSTMADHGSKFPPITPEIIFHGQTADDTYPIIDLVSGLSPEVSPCAVLTHHIGMAFTHPLTIGATMMLTTKNNSHPSAHHDVSDSMTTEEKFFSDARNGWIDYAIIVISRRGALCRLMSCDDKLETRMEYSEEYTTDGGMIDALNRLLKMALNERTVSPEEQVTESAIIARSVIERAKSTTH